MNKKTFSGGYRFKRIDYQPEDKLQDLGIPEKVYIPTKQGFGNALAPSVEEGQRVTCGEIIARNDDNISSPIHASISGVVTEVSKFNRFGQEVYQVCIRKEGKQKVQTLGGSSPDWQALSTPEIEKLIYFSGASSLGHEGIPTSFKSSPVNPPGVEEVIIHGVQSEVYNISLEVLLGGKNLDHLSEGIEVLKKIYPQARFHLALNSEKRDKLKNLATFAADREGIESYWMLPKYPQGCSQVLVATILGMDVPYGVSLATRGIVVLDLPAVLAVYRAVICGYPLISRVVALCGQGWKENLHLDLRVGTPLKTIYQKYLTKEFDSRIVLNSLFTGADLSDARGGVDRTFSHLIALKEDKERKFFAFARPGKSKESFSNAFLSSLIPWGKKNLTTNLGGEPRPCVTCGWCERVCPAGLIPHLIYGYLKNAFQAETLMKLEIYNCVECGLCTFVCPSKLFLASSIKEGKEKLSEEGFKPSSKTQKEEEIAKAGGAI